MHEREAGLVPIFEPVDRHQLMTVKLALDDAGVRYLVENEHFHSVAGARTAIGDTALRILVHRDDAVRAQRTIEACM